jgi:isopentenyl-diphosphate delta-isomerase
MAAKPEDIEILDLVDDANEVIGQVKRSEVYGLQYESGHLRAADIFIVNSEGKLWVPVRTADKKMFPNGFDFAAAEHVESGESFIDAAVRGLDEELNLTVDPGALVQGGILPATPQINYFRALFVHKTDDTPQYNPDDFSSAAWLTKDEVRQKIAAGYPAKNAIVPSIDYLESKGLI